MRGVRTPYLLVLEHHLVDAASQGIAPLVPRAWHSLGVLRPVLEVDGMAFQAVLQATTAAPVAVCRRVVGFGPPAWDDVERGLEVLFLGLPHWPPRQGFGP